MSDVLLLILGGAVATGLVGVFNTIRERRSAGRAARLRGLSWDFSMDQARLIAALAGNDERTAADLAAHSHLSPSAVLEALRGLVRGGWVQLDEQGSIPVARLTPSATREIEFSRHDMPVPPRAEMRAHTSSEQLDAAIDDAVDALPRQ